MADEALRELKKSQCGTPCKRGMSRQSRRERGSIAARGAMSGQRATMGGTGRLRWWPALSSTPSWGTAQLA